MSNVPIEIDQDALREYLEGLPVFGEGSQTFGDVQRQFDEMERLGIIPAGQTTGRFPMVVPQTAVLVATLVAVLVGRRWWRGVR
jgi:hypothetical protein